MATLLTFCYCIDWFMLYHDGSMLYSICCHSNRFSSLRNITRHRQYYRSQFSHTAQSVPLLTMIILASHPGFWWAGIMIICSECVSKQITNSAVTYCWWDGQKVNSGNNKCTAYIASWVPVTLQAVQASWSKSVDLLIMAPLKGVFFLK